MADISKITLPSGNTYDIKDAVARAAIAELSGSTYIIGVTTTPLTDGATTNPIIVNGSSVTAKNGGIAFYQNGEFVFNGTQWFEFGDTSTLGALAYKDTVSLGKGSGKTVLGTSATFTSTVTPTTASVPNVTSVGSASTWSFQMGTGTASETLIIDGANGAAPTVGTAISAMTGASVATSVNSADSTKVAKYDDLSVTVS